MPENGLGFLEESQLELQAWWSLANGNGSSKVVMVACVMCVL